MKLYKALTWWHPKNNEGMELMNSVQPVNNWNGENDGVILCSIIDINIVNNYDNVICGPHVDFLEALTFFKNYNENKPLIYNVLSKWQKKLFELYAPNKKVKYVCLPFPVNVDKFVPTKKTNRFFIYYKHVHSSRLNTIIELIKEKKLDEVNEYKIFTYGSYNENDYLSYISSCKFGIWVGSHESQGFALEEALSCDCPLFVCDVNSLKDECVNDSNYCWEKLVGDYPATSATYFDETCGKICEYGSHELHSNFDEFIRDIESYKPREYILNNLTNKKCLQMINDEFPHL